MHRRSAYTHSARYTAQEHLHKAKARTVRPAPSRISSSALTQHTPKAETKDERARAEQQHKTKSNPQTTPEAKAPA